jgi:transposase
MMFRRRRHYDKAFKLEVVKRTLEGTPVKSIAEELDISPVVISRWRKQFLVAQSEEKQVFPGKGNESLTEEQKKIKKLEKALKDKELELEILKKAIGIFSKKDRTSTGSSK